MIRWLVGVALGALGAAVVLDVALLVQQIFEGPSWAGDDFQHPVAFAGFFVLSAVIFLLPTAACAFFTDGVLQIAGQNRFAAYGLAGLIEGAALGAFVAAFTPQSDEDGGEVTGAALNALILNMSLRYALIGLTASSIFWWVVRRKGYLQQRTR